MTFKDYQDDPETLSVMSPSSLSQGRDEARMGERREGSTVVAVEALAGAARAVQAGLKLGSSRRTFRQVNF
jgi:hypothetical protein